MAEMHSWAVGSDTERLVTVEDARAAVAALLASDGGIIPRTGFVVGSGNPGLVSASGTPDTNVHVNAFQLILPNSRGVWPYTCTLDAPKALDVLVTNPADPANSRHDLIVAQQSDAFYGDTDSLFRVLRITGTPSATPADPDVPGSPDYELLARIRVTAGATAITPGMIDDLRTSARTTGRGGVIPCTSTTRPASPHAGMVIFETDTGLMLVRNGNSGQWEQVWTEVANTMSTALPLRLTTTSDASLTSTTHGLQIGPTSGQNLRFDNEEIQAVNNGGAGTLRLNASGGVVQVGTGGLDVDGPAIFDGTISASPLQSASSLAIQFEHGYAIYVDNINVSGTAGDRFWLDTPANSDVIIGPRTGTSTILNLRLRTHATTASAANMFLDSSTYQVRRSTSSLRYKTDVVDLDLDLDAVRNLRPVRFRDRSEVEENPSEPTSA
jgi:hypothetical protein